MEYEVNNGGVNCNVPYLIDFDIHSEQKQITHRHNLHFFAFSPSSKIKKKNDVSEAGSASVFRRRT